MTTAEETKTLLIEQGAKMVDARIRGFEAEVALVKAGTDWSAAATDLAKALGNVIDISADDQYECFVTACQLSDVDPEHPALQEERDAFKAMKSGLN